MYDDNTTSHQRGVRMRLDATAARPPGRRQPWSVTAGRWSAEATTEKAAADALAERLLAFLIQYEPPSVLSFRGYTAVVEIDLGDDHAPVAWCYRIITPDGRTSITGTGSSSWAEAEAAARHDLAHRSTDWHDDNSVHAAAGYLAAVPAGPGSPYGPDELYQYAAFQRAARVAMATGREDWHEWSTAHRHEFTVRRSHTPSG